MIWIIGTGLMAKDYAKVLNALGKDYLAIGRGETNCASFEKEYGKTTISGGLENTCKPNQQCLMLQL
jgi:hypothetical protein